MTQDVLSLGRAWERAEWRGDTGFLDGLPTGDFRGVGPPGFLLTKPQWPHRSRPGHFRCQSLSWEDAERRLCGD